jgi:hypothetical protein
MRLLVVLAAIVAVLLGGMTAFKPGMPPKTRSYTVGVASARALVDTPSSQVVNLGLRQDATAALLPSRAILLANLLASTPFKQETAKRAGVPSNRLIALADTATDSGPSVENPLATGATVKQSDPKANVLTAHTDPSLPLITVNVQAPDPAVASRIANSAIAVLGEQLSSLAASQQVPAKKRLVVKPLGTAQVGTERRGPSPMIALVAIPLIFLVLCALIVPIVRIVRQFAAGPTDVAPDDEPWPEWDDEDADEVEQPFAFPTVTPRGEGRPAGTPRARADLGP